jgi:hypothetical protein
MEIAGLQATLANQGEGFLMAAVLRINRMPSPLKALSITHKFHR